MSSILFWFWSFLFLGIYFENEVQGKSLRRIDGSMKNGSILYKATSEDATIEYALDSKTSSYDLEWNAATDMMPIWAILGTYRGEYYSARATISVHELPQVGRKQESRASIWVVNRGDGSPRSKNVIQAGWHVYPEKYGDTVTRFFVHWAADGGNRGCFNLDCEGFKLSKSSNYTPGTHISPLSTYNGIQYFIYLKISKDPQTGDWWLHHGPNYDMPVGYWPKSLFTGLQDSATHVQYGGVVRYFVNDVSPPMGSGHFAEQGVNKSASLTNVELNDIPYDRDDDERFFFDATEDACYTITKFNTFEETKRLYFGGPRDCPA